MIEGTELTDGQVSTTVRVSTFSESSKTILLNYVPNTPAPHINVQIDRIRTADQPLIPIRAKACYGDASNTNVEPIDINVGIGAIATSEGIERGIAIVE